MSVDEKRIEHSSHVILSSYITTTRSQMCVEVSGQDRISSEVSNIATGCIFVSEVQQR